MQGDVIVIEKALDRENINEVIESSRAFLEREAPTREKPADRDRDGDRVFPEYVNERPTRGVSDKTWDSRGDGFEDRRPRSPLVTIRRSSKTWDSRGDGFDRSYKTWDSRGDGFTPAFKGRGLGLPLPRGSFEGPSKHYLPTRAWESAQMLERIAQLERTLEANRRLPPVQHTETPKKGKGRLSFFSRYATIP